jgi:hypothetical protein
MAAWWLWAGFRYALCYRYSPGAVIWQGDKGIAPTWKKKALSDLRDYKKILTSQNF